jgi:exosortase/archaeosortase family protein
LDAGVPPAAELDRPPLSTLERSARWLAASMLVVAGGLLIIFAQVWRGIEAILAAHSIHLATGQTAIAVPAHHLLILYKSASVQSTFVLTSECSVAYLLAALLIGSAPLMFLRRLSPWRTAFAVVVTTLILILVNIARLTAIGATVSEWGTNPGFAIAHTYLGSVLTVVGTCGAGVAFAAILVRRRSPRPTVSTGTG